MPLGLENEFLLFFEKVKQRDGLTADHVSKFIQNQANGHTPIEAILKHDFFVQLVTRTEASPADTLINYIDVTIDELPEQRASSLRWVLNVGSGPEFPVREQLVARREIAARDLSESRSTKFGASKFAGKDEPEFLATLCGLLDIPHKERLDRLGVQVGPFEEFLGDVPAVGHIGKVVVLGGAVMDINFLIQDYPDPGSSVQANNFKMHPGGKALTQAVACARLGLDTKIVATIGCDNNGNEIKSFLESEGVDTSLLKMVEGAQTAVTGVIQTRKRDSYAIGWKNENRLPLPPDRISESAVSGAIAGADYLLCSFEVPPDTVEEALKIAHENGVTTIVTSAPPYAPQILDQGHHAFIDFLVCNSWELENFGHYQDDDGTIELDDPELLFQRPSMELLTNGKLGCLVVTHNKNCHVYFRPKGAQETTSIENFTVQSLRPSYSETVGERDAFCAMLAKMYGEFSNDSITFLDLMHWATAAMTSLSYGLGVPLTMPQLHDVERRYDQVRASQPISQGNHSANGE